MTDKETRSGDGDGLRERAEARLGAAQARPEEALLPGQAQQVFHDLRVHQIELEMQNEELRRVQAEVEALRERYFDLYGMTNPLRLDLDLIRRNVEMETALIDDLLDVTRINHGKIDLHQEVMDIQDCLKMALDICQKNIDTKRLEVRLEFLATQHHVWADPARLRQVFWNLLRNAVKFTSEEGRITLCTQNIGDRLKIEIIDTGVGIEPEAISRIFNLFEQGERAKIRQFGGLGLGLHFAKAVVELHQGRLTAFSEGKNKGATFTVELATVPPRQKAAIPISSVEPEECPLRILLVEDHPDTLQVLVKLLEKWGHTVTTAASFRKAQELVAGQEFDLLISDLGLPDGSGLDVMRQVKARFAIPGIALSGYGAEDDIRQSKTAGFAGHLVKPVNIAAMRAAIRQFAFAGS